MRKTLSIVFLASSLFAVGCKKKGGSSEALSKLQETADKVCNAKDLQAATKIQDDYTKWAQDWAKNNAGDAKAGEQSEADAKAFTDASKKLTDCFQKLAASGAGSAAAAGSDKPATDTAAPPPDKASAGSADKPADGSATPDKPADKPADGSAAGSAK